jgi:hypothetical protein
VYYRVTKEIRKEISKQEQIGCGAFFEEKRLPLMRG